MEHPNCVLIWRQDRLVRAHDALWHDLGKVVRASERFNGRHVFRLPCHSMEETVNAIVRRRLEMAARVRDFLRTHKTDGVGEGLGLAKLEDLITRAETLATQQRGGLVAARAATLARWVTTCRALLRESLPHLEIVV